MSTPRSIRQARRQKHDPWGKTAPAGLDSLPPIEWAPAIPIGEATELPTDEGMQQFRMAQQLQEQK